MKHSRVPLCVLVVVQISPCAIAAPRHILHHREIVALIAIVKGLPSWRVLERSCVTVAG